MKTKETLYLSARLNEQFNTKLVSYTLITISTLLLGLIVWAVFTRINEIAIAKGEIEPNGYVIKIQYLDGGILDSLNVREGDYVAKGASLGRMKNIGIEEDFKKVTIDQQNVEMQIIRIESVINNIPINFDKYEVLDPDIVVQQQKIYDDQLISRDSQRKVLLDQYHQQEYLYKRLIAQKETIEKELPIAKEMYAIYEHLAKQGNTPKIKQLDEKRKIVNLEGEYKMLKVNLKQAEEKIKEYQSKIASFDATYNEKLNSDLERLENQRLQNEEQLSKLQKSKERLTLTTPENGIIKAINISNSDEVVNPGQVIMEIIPTDKPIVARIKISPSDIGHVQVGDIVRVKVSSYDYVRYGVVDGELLQVSPTTLKDESGKSFYKGLVRLKKNYIGDNSSENLILPGMVIQAEIVTDEKSIMAYLLKPIYLSMTNAMGER